MAEMSREEAKADFERLKSICEVRKAFGCSRCKNRCDMAITALLQPEIIHCVECKHFIDYGCTTGDCEAFSRGGIAKDGFCYKAERRTDG